VDGRPLIDAPSVRHWGTQKIENEGISHDVAENKGPILKSHDVIENEKVTSD
jgi:hypothetical protein